MLHVDACRTADPACVRCCVMTSAVAITACKILCVLSTRAHSMLLPASRPCRQLLCPLAHLDVLNLLALHCIPLVVQLGAQRNGLLIQAVEHRQPAARCSKKTGEGGRALQACAKGRACAGCDLVVVAWQIVGSCVGCNGEAMQVSWVRWGNSICKVCNLVMHA
jgi:hypothetical protein